MLTLPIKKKWFDMILYGKKKEEYREIKPYYNSRFAKALGISQDIIFYECGITRLKLILEIDTNMDICFRNGYSAKSPSFIAKCELSIGIGRAEWGAEPGKDYYKLTIKEITERSGC